MYTQHNSEFHDDGVVVNGHNAKVYGNGCTVNGHNAEIYGNDAIVNGHNAIGYGTGYRVNGMNFRQVRDGKQRPYKPSKPVKPRKPIKPSKFDIHDNVWDYDGDNISGSFTSVNQAFGPNSIASNTGNLFIGDDGIIADDIVSTDYVSAGRGIIQGKNITFSGTMDGKPFPKGASGKGSVSICGPFTVRNAGASSISQVGEIWNMKIPNGGTVIFQDVERVYGPGNDTIVFNKWGIQTGGRDPIDATDNGAKVKSDDVQPVHHKPPHHPPPVPVASPDHHQPKPKVEEPPKKKQQKFNINGIVVPETEKGNLADNPEMECSRCLDNKKCTTIKPCGHVVLCVACSHEVVKSDPRCPVCRKNIKKVEKVFI